jgi:hypothetical protein
MKLLVVPGAMERAAKFVEEEVEVAHAEPIDAIRLEISGAYELTD